MDIDHEIMVLIEDIIQLGNRARTLKPLVSNKLRSGGGALADVPTVADLLTKQADVYWRAQRESQNTGTTGIRDGAQAEPGTRDGDTDPGEAA